jgi:hypothetical protein
MFTWTASVEGTKKLARIKAAKRDFFIDDGEVINGKR